MAFNSMDAAKISQNSIDSSKSETKRVKDGWFELFLFFYRKTVFLFSGVNKYLHSGLGLKQRKPLQYFGTWQNYEIPYGLSILHGYNHESIWIPFTFYKIHS